VVTVLDTEQLPAEQRRGAQVTARLEATMASRVEFGDVGRMPRARLDAWDLAGLEVLRADLSGGPALSGPARDDVEPTVSFGVQEFGVAWQAHLGRQRVVPRGGLALTEVTSPYAYRWAGRGVCRALQVPVGRLGLSVDAVRRAVPLASRSPLYRLVNGHLAQVTRDAARLAEEPAAHWVAAATVDLTRALLASVVGSGRAVDDVAAETLLARVRSYVRQHLAEPDLDAAQVAAACAVSVRQLYRLCAAAQFSLEQWVIQQRLEGARGELSDPGSRDRPIALVARHWGFTDPSHFSRRFRAAFDMTPRDWRRLHPAAVVLPAPRRGDGAARAGSNVCSMP
jgi:AraC-like DNA-binding protein